MRGGRAGPVEVARLATVRAHLARARGEADPALDAAAAEAWRAVARPYPAAIAQLRRRRRRWSRAATATPRPPSSPTCSPTADALGAPWLRAEAEGLAGRARLARSPAGDAQAPRSPQPRGEDPFGLTPRERQVLALRRRRARRTARSARSSSWPRRPRACTSRASSPSSTCAAAPRRPPSRTASASSAEAMTTPQRPIGSGFGYRTTAAEVLEGIDLGGRLAIVTGGYSGLGLETVRALSGAGATVIVPARRPEHAEEVLAGVDRVEVDELDLGDLESVRGFAERVLDAGRGVDILINNAAIMACPETRVGPGWEAQFATNHLGHFALANLLWPPLAAGDGARVVALSSTGHKLSRHPLRRPAVRARLRQVGRVRPGQDAPTPVRRAARRARPGRRRARVRRAPRRDHDPAAAPPLARGDGRLRLDRRGRQRRRALQDARAGRLDLDVGGDLTAARRAWAASTARTATSPKPTEAGSPTRAHRGRRRPRDRPRRRRAPVGGLGGAHRRRRLRAA